jgi:energy-coupling factor transport system permease protein
VLAATVVASLLAKHTASVGVICLALLLVLFAAPGQRRSGAQGRWPYIVGTAITALLVIVLTPFVEQIGSHPIWTGPTVPVLGTLDVTHEELANAVYQGLRLAAVGLAFAVYATTLDHDRLLASAGWARKSTLAVAIATRLLPTLERDARDLRTALKGRGVELGPVRLLSPLLAGSLERGLNVAEAMEARGYGKPGRTRAPLPSRTAIDYAAFASAVVLIVAGALWL